MFSLRWEILKFAVEYLCYVEGTPCELLQRRAPDGLQRTSVCFFAFGDKMMLSVGRAFCDSSGVAA